MTDPQQVAGTPAAPEGTVPEGAVPEGAVSEGAVSEGTVSEGAVPEGAQTTGRAAPSVPSARPVDARGAARRLGGRVAGASESYTLLALVILIVFFSVKAPGKFFTLSDFSLMGQNAAPLLVMAVGETFVIITAGIDLAVGSLLVLAGVVTDLYCIHHGGANAGWGTIAIGSVLGLATGAGWGAIQGFLVAKAKVPPLIVTLAGFIAAGEGVAYLITGGADFRTVPGKLVNTIGLDSVAGIPWLIVISFAVAIVAGLVLAYTRFGRYTYAIGSNAEAARRAGIRVDRHLIKVYALSGLLAGVAGILSLASFDSTTIAGHAFDNLEAITAVALGGASLFGGRGSMFGTVIGLAISTVLLEGLVIIGVNQYWQEVAIGIVLVAAVYLDQFRRRLRQRA
jgi:ribose transport system permease protein